MVQQCLVCSCHLTATLPLSWTWQRGTKLYMLLMLGTKETVHGECNHAHSGI